MVVLSGFRMTFVLSVFTCRALRISTSREKACDTHTYQSDRTPNQADSQSDGTPNQADSQSDGTMNQAHRVGRNALQPVVIEIKQNHLRLSGLQNEVSKFLNLQTCLERQLQLTALDHNVWEVQQVDLWGMGVGIASLREKRPSG